MKNEDIVMTLLESLPASYEYLITTLKTMSIKNLSMDYVTMRLVHELLKHKENEANIRLPPWCCDKIKVAIHSCAKTQSHAFLAANRAKLHIFATK